MKQLLLGTLCVLCLFGFSGCRTEVATVPPSLTPFPTATAAFTPTPTMTVKSITFNDTAVLAEVPAPTLTPIPTSTDTPTPAATATPTPTPTATPIGPCHLRHPQDDLLAVVTKTYGLSRDYAPADLVLLTDFLPIEITLGYPSEVRAVVLEPLRRLLDDMVAAGLQPQLLSGYRSYSAQSIAYDKWLREFPDRVDILSAPPGHSEHQLGTTLDFGSPELADIIGDPDLQFHTYFYQTSEGIWLAEHAHEYGFTLSYPRSAIKLTGFYYEPWHYRFVGVEMATMLYNQNLSLTEFQLANQPEPCLPD